MQYLLICFVALTASVITLLTGFGLGTVLIPVFAFFFPLPLAIAATAVIHLVNNVFQVLLVGRFAKGSVVLRFGIPATFTSLLGAFLLIFFAGWDPIFSYKLFGVSLHVTIVGLIVGAVVITAALFELVPSLVHLSLPAKYTPIGGGVSGFLGGLSGNQGALRAAFLIKSGLTKEQFIGTSAVCSILVDVPRLLVYGIGIYYQRFKGLNEISHLIIAASLAACLGSLIGSKLMPKITFKTLQIIIGSLLLFLGFAILIGASKQ